MAPRKVVYGLAGLLVILILILAVAAMSPSAPPTSTTPKATLSPSPSYQITSNPNDATKFTHTSNKGYSITYPKEWDKDISTSAGVPVDIYLYPNPNNKADGVVVATYGITAGATQDAFVNYNVFELTNYSNHGVYKNFTILNQTSTTLSGKPANTIVWTGVIPVQYTATSYADTSMKVMQTYVINNNVGYVVTYKATSKDYNTYLAQAQQTINSFTVPGVNAPATPTATPAATVQGITPTATPNSNTLSAWNNAFSKAGYEIFAPFKQNLGAISGTVNGGGNKLKPYKYDISIREVATRDEAKAAFNAAITKAQQQGYQSGSVNIDPDRSWSGYLGNQGFQSDKIVRIHIEEPDTLWTLVWDPFVIVPGPHTMYYVETTYSTTI